MLWIMAPVRNVYFLTGIANCGYGAAPGDGSDQTFHHFIRAAAKNCALPSPGNQFNPTLLAAPISKLVRVDMTVREFAYQH